LFPATLLVLLRFAGLRSAIVVYLAAALLILLWRIILIGVFHADWYRIYIGTDTRIDCIFFGVILALVLQDDRWRIKFLAAANFRMLLVGVSLLILSLAVRNQVYRETFRYTLQGLGLFLTITPIIAGNIPNRLKSLIESPISQYIGKLSYSLYLYHLVVLFWLIRLGLLGETGALVVAGLISVALSVLSYHFVEQPMLRLRRTFGSRATY